ncbi:MAG: histidine phosphatase family protein [Chloroflexi bacterium]|nr:histidine phosphatase family protein [Chloroflexota bacterium]
MRRLVLVKHSMPDIDPSKPASTWRLGNVGRYRAGVLATKLRSFSPELIWSSREPKAVETASIVARTFDVTVRLADGLEEHHRDEVPYLPKREFENTVEAFFHHSDQLVLGSETAKQACERFTASIENVMKTGQKDIIVITHGTVISLYAASVAKVHSMSLWHQLGLPSYVVLTLPSMKIQTTVGSVTASEDAD